MKTILVATDFSNTAHNAAIYATDMALKITADIFLLHICQIPAYYGEMPVPEVDEKLNEDAEKCMVELKAELNRKANGRIKIEAEVKTGVFFFTELKEACERINPYLVIMGTQGKTRVERIFFGNQSVYAMKHLLWPLVTVPPGMMFSSIKKIGLACDYDKVFDTIPLDEITILVNDFHAELHVLNTGKRQMSNTDVAFETNFLEKMLVSLKPKYHFIANGNIDDSIINFAEQNNIDLLIVLPKRHGLLDMLTQKSHTKQFVLYSHVPVMALHP
jgi:nucleotide-binding universal stress UspA family protein